MGFAQAPQGLGTPSAQGRWILLLGACALLIGVPEKAEAQYRNQQIGFDAGYVATTRKSSFATPGVTGLAPTAERSLRMGWGSRIGFEYASKISDAWWFTARGNLAFMGMSPRSSEPNYQQIFDGEGRDTVGPLITAGAQIGARHYFLTDQIRPYLGVGTSFTYVGSLKGTVANSTCPQICSATTEDVFREFIPYRFIWGQHLIPGIEFILKSDTALNIFADTQNWFLLEAPDTQAVVGGAGLSFFF